MKSSALKGRTQSTQTYQLMQKKVRDKASALRTRSPAIRPGFGSRSTLRWTSPWSNTAEGCGRHAKCRPPDRYGPTADVVLVALSWSNVRLPNAIIMVTDGHRSRLTSREPLGVRRRQGGRDCKEPSSSWMGAGGVVCQTLMSEFKRNDVGGGL